ncbi:MAG: deoxyribonuclease IV [Euryarchaeota archaeon]|nr:deoxyribonuclease IV [Euryarchaeota archaeon]
MVLLGAHTSIAGGVATALVKAKELDCESVQIFTKNQRQWEARPYEPEDIALWRKLLKETGIKRPVAHAGYLINMASPDTGLRAKSVAAFIDEIRRSELLGLHGLIFHPGSHTGAGEEVGFENVSVSVNEALAATKGGKTIVLLENAAGQGTNVGRRFEDLATMIDKIHDKKRVGVCFDTCHAFAAGYDLRTETAYEKTMGSFDALLGTKLIQAFHLNDSKGPFDGRLDRHEHIGEGGIGKEGFRTLLNDARFKDTPGNIETDPEEDERMPGFRRDLAALRALRR